MDELAHTLLYIDEVEAIVVRCAHAARHTHAPLTLDRSIITELTNTAPTAFLLGDPFDSTRRMIFECTQSKTQ